MKRILLILGIVIILLGLYFSYNTYIGATHVAFINFPDFQLARIEKANENSWIKIHPIKVDEIPEASSDYHAIFIFGRGLQLSPEQISSLKEMGYSGSYIYVQGATNPNMDISNLNGQDLDFITDYLRNGGSENYAAMLNYTRLKFDGKTVFTSPLKEPKIISRDVLFHLDEAIAISDFNAFQNYLEENRFYFKNRPKIALLTSVPGPFNANRDHLISIIQKFIDKKYTIYPVASALKRFDYLKKIDPDLIISMPHGRLTLGQSKELSSWLKEKKIPVLSPLSVFDHHDSWLNDPQGMSGGMLSMNVVLPEIDGAINPYAIVAQYTDDMGYKAFNAIPERLEKFASMVDKWFALKEKNNADKKIAIYYFKGPGKNALVASNMEIVPSIFNFLKNLKKSGYTVDNLPNSSEELEAIIQKSGAVLGPYAKGSFQRFLKEGKPALVPTETYLEWVKNDIHPKLFKGVTDKYGPAPGDYLSVEKGDQSAIAVSRVKFGNVILLPQPLPGVGDDTFKLIHGTDAAVPHPYLASYLWTRNKFKADAIIHFGTHGSLEFTQGKQIALSDMDWADALIGNTPHFYLYTVSNVGEGIIAKRRSYATTITHLTPPFIESGIYPELKELQNLTKKYLNQIGSELKTEYAGTILKMLKKTKLFQDLEIDTLTLPGQSAIEKVNKYLETVSTEKINAGLYHLGVPYKEKFIKSTNELILLDDIAYSLSELDLLKKKITPEQQEDPVYFNANYRKTAKRIIRETQRKKGGYNLSKLIGRNDLKRFDDWKKLQSGPSESDIIRGFISMGSRKKRGHKRAKEKASPTEIRDLVIKISADKEKKEFIENLKSEKRFKESSGLLDPKTLAKAKMISKMIPKMKRAIEVGLSPDVFKLLKIMQDTEQKALVFSYLDDNNLIDQINKEKETARQKIITEMQSNEGLKRLVQGKKLFQKTSLKNLRSYEQDAAYLLKHQAITTELFNISGNEIKSLHDRIVFHAGIKKREEDRFFNSIQKIKRNIDRVASTALALKNSPGIELSEFASALDGSYISPTSGGDPIINPQSVPTGRNLYSIDAEKTPSPEAWQLGVKLSESLLEQHLKKNGKYPEKVSFTLWPGDFIGTEGATIAQIFYLLGVKPVWDPLKRVQDVRLIPTKELKRPRIDIVLQTAGQFRDLAASRMFLINKAIELAASQKDGTDHVNFVRAGVKNSETFLKSKGFSPVDARKFSTVRIFGGVNGNYGTNIMGLVESSDRWETDEEIAKTYIGNMGAYYHNEDSWGNFREGVFESALLNTEVVIQPRESNTWGALSLDHVYEFMGGLNLAVRHVTGKDPDAYFNDFRNPSKSKVQNFTEAMWTEARSTLLNPNYLKELSEGEASSAEKFAETFRNTFGWTVMKPEAMKEELWEELYDTFINDRYKLDLESFFKTENPYALQEITAVMLETIRKGYWKADDATIKELSKRHSELVKEFEASGSTFVSDNKKLQDYISSNISASLNEAYTKAIDSDRNEAASTDDDIVLESEQERKKKSIDKQDQEKTYYWYILILFIGLIIYYRLKRTKGDD